MQPTRTTDSDTWFDIECDALAKKMRETMMINGQNNKEKIDDIKGDITFACSTSQHATPVTSSLPSHDKVSSHEPLSSSNASASISPSAHKKKHVRFVDTPDIIPRARRCHQNNPSRSWYTPKEMNSIFRGVRSLLKELKHMKLDDSTLLEVQDCLRGLEGVFPLMLLIHRDQDNQTMQRCSGHSHPHHDRKKHNKFVRTILECQEDQKSSADFFSLSHNNNNNNAGGISDPISLRMVSISCSQKSRELGIARAAQDFLEVQKLWNTNINNSKQEVEEVTTSIAHNKACLETNFTIVPEHRSNTYPFFPSKVSSLTSQNSCYSSLDHFRSTSLVSGAEQLSSFF